MRRYEDISLLVHINGNNEQNKQKKLVKSNKVQNGAKVMKNKSDIYIK